MKLLREHINEKFTEDSDPIADMNIGMIHDIKLWMESMGKLFRNKDHALACSAIYGKLDFVEYLLAAGANVHANNDLALQLASDNGHTGVVKVLLAAGANVHANNDYALRWASYNGHTEVVKVLLAAGADVHTYNDSALRYANKNGHIEVIKILKDHITKEKRKKVKESMNEKFTQDSDPIADMNIGMMHEIKLWMESINDSFYDKDYALGISAENGKLDFVEYLLADDAYVHANNDYALRWASENGHTEVVKVLLTAGANVHARNNYALRWANFNEHTEVVKVLKDHIAKEKRKKVKENVNEKFTEDSDPIQDMNIGLNVKRNFDTHKELDQWIVDKLPYILKMNEIPKDIIKSENKWFPDKYDEKIGEYITKYITVNNKEQNWFSWHRAGIQKLLIEMGFKT